MSAIRRRAQALLDAGVPPLWQRLHDKRCVALLDAYDRHLADAPLSEHLVDDDAYFQQSLATFLRSRVADALNEIGTLGEGKQLFDVRIGRATSRREKEVLLLDYARELGAGTRQLRGDRKALRRWLAEDALRDRYHSQVAELEQAASFALDRLGAITSRALAEPGDAGPQETWYAMRFDDLCERLLAAEADPRLVETALNALLACVDVMMTDTAQDAVGDLCRQQIYRLALDPDQPVWLQRAGLRLMARIAADTLPDILRYRLGQPAEGDDLFVRAAAVDVWSAQLDREPTLVELAATIAGDPSAHVRQRLAERLPDTAGLGHADVLGLLGRLGADKEPCVRAAAAEATAVLFIRAPQHDAPRRDALAAHLLRCLREERDEFTCRVLLESHAALSAAFTADQEAAVLALIGERHRGDASLKIRRWCAEIRERMLFTSDVDWHQTFIDVSRQLRAGVDELDLSALPNAATHEVTMRVLSAAAQRNFGIDVERDGERAIARRGFRFGFRLWRLLHEWRHPSTDKRQGFRHTIGRHYRGTERAPSAILAEVSQTKVPGEPLTYADEDGWRPYLPLVDECLAALDQDRETVPHRIHTSEGVTEILPPATLRGQLRAWWQLTCRFTQFAEWRNWRDGDPGAPSHYVDELRRLGFRLAFTPHDDPVTRQPCADPSVMRFFNALAPAPWLTDLIGDFRAHALSAYENTVFQLAAYVAAIAAFFFGRHLVLAQLLKRARRRLPLVVGGWGTRGKSGTERLKAAMFNALGLSVFSKTTGCEAMFVMNRPYRRAKELFLFRPYDKATIWEQFNMVRLASNLDSDVFLWECMGLTPSYVRVLQRDWMRDDISTITNTFPDHEDLQGPAGIDIPEVMCEFIPPAGRLVTSEEKMLPILARGAAERGASIHSVGWHEAGLLAPDVLDRFPYEEHPYNIALVLGLARELGIDRDLALKEMADRVVMDLGVLKSYPSAAVDGRRIEFIMGMSANERFGALNNWQRMGLDDTTPDNAPSVWVATLVNNRADRVPRSRVFADILVQDLAADQHFLIGSNLKGMRGYIDESWAAWTGELQLSGDVESALAEIAEWSRRLRIPLTLPALGNRLQPLLCGAALSTSSLDAMRESVTAAALPTEADSWAQRFIEQHESYATFESELRSVSTATAEQQANFALRFRDQLRDWFEQKLVFVDDAHIDGDDLVKLVAGSLPPQFETRLMGMQNIKGTGLPFVYCWQAWEKQWHLAEQLSGDDDGAFADALEQLAADPAIATLARSHLTATLERARHHPAAQRESAQAQLAMLAARLDGTDTVRGPREGPARPNWLEHTVDVLEGLLDAGDAVRRRRTADRVYRDIVTQRISEDRAIAEIQKINKRQKGGWLRGKLTSWLG